MDKFDTRQNVLWAGALELAADTLNLDPNQYPDEVEDLAEQLWLEMCNEEGLDPYA